MEDAARAARPQPCLAAAQQVHSARSSTADVDFMAWTIEFSNIQLLKPIGQGAFGQVGPRMFDTWAQGAWGTVRKTSWGPKCGTK